MIKKNSSFLTHCLVEGKAWQTPLGRYAPKASSGANPGGAALAVVLQIPLEGTLSRCGGIQFVLKRAQGSQPEWLTGPGGKDFFVDITQVRAVIQHEWIWQLSKYGSLNSLHPHQQQRNGTLSLTLK